MDRVTAFAFQVVVEVAFPTPARFAAVKTTWSELETLTALVTRLASAADAGSFKELRGVPFGK